MTDLDDALRLTEEQSKRFQQAMKLLNGFYTCGEYMRDRLDRGDQLREMVESNMERVAVFIEKNGG